MKLLWFASLPLLVVGWDLGAQQNLNQTLEEYRHGLKEGDESWAHQCSQTLVDLDLNFLYWRAENHGFSVALSEKSNQTFDGNNPGGRGLLEVYNLGRIVRVDPKWEPGFRVGLGWNSDYDRWNTRLGWTWYHNHSSKVRSKFAPNTSSDAFYSEWPVSYQNSGFFASLYGPHSTVHASWQLWYNTLDLELSRSYYISDAVALVPLVSVRAAQIHQHFAEKFKGAYYVNTFDEMPGIGLSDSADDFHGKNNWRGIGPRFGMSGFWDLRGGFSFLGKAAVSLLYGPTKVHSYTYVYPTATDATGQLGREVSEHFNALIPNLELFFGFSWAACLSSYSMFLGIDVGWELNYWENQFNIPVQLAGAQQNAPLAFMGVPLPTVGNQPLTLEGMTMNVHLDF